ncbi:hypothetical protein ACDN41_12655 [Priestia aryabhattai]|uniref:hypothetical protein n=1 Tax=Priestia aryabhattai TaxID=412384 RepID=UPI00353269A6
MSEENLNIGEWTELASLSDYITQYGSGSSLYDISLSDLYRYLKNPHANIENIRKASKYFTNKHGVIKEVLRTMKSLPSLNYRLSWSSYDNVKKIKNYESKINDFLDDIDVVSMVRDGLYEVGEMGTIVTCLRSKKYVQFLELDDLRINKQRNGKWVVEYDLSTISSYSKTMDKMAIIESLPDEVTVKAYNLYKNKGEDYRYVELKNCDVISIDANRNFPYGLPYTLGAWSSLLQKDVINRVERSVADRIVKQILILYAHTIDKEGLKPPKREIIQSYFKDVSNLMKQKDGMTHTNNSDSSGTGVVTLPHFMKLEALKVNTEMFKKELYDKVNNDVFMNLGVSPALIYGGDGGNFSSSQVNSSKFFRYIFSIVDKFERVINQYIKSILPKDLSCKFSFTRSTILDHDKHVAQCKDLYMQTGIIEPWLNAMDSNGYMTLLSQAKYEKEVLGVDKFIFPPQNAFTQSGDSESQGGRPENNNPSNENTIKSKSSGGNNNPEPTQQ